MPEPSPGRPGRTRADSPPKIRRFAGLVLLATLAVSLAVLSVQSRRSNDAYLDIHMAIASEMTKLEMAAIVERELVLMEKFAGDALLMRFFQNPDDEVMAAQVEAELNSYQRHLKQGCAFWAASDNVVHFCGAREDFRADPANPDHQWYLKGIESSLPYHADTTYDADGNISTIYIIVPVKSLGGEVLGVVGSAIDTRYLDERLRGVYELIDRNLVYHIFDSEYTIIASNGEKDLIKRVSILETFPKLGPRFAEVAGVSDFANWSHRIDRDVFILTRIPEFNWFLVVHYRLPRFGFINRSVARTFKAMLAVCGALVLVFYFYCLYCFRPAGRGRPGDAPPEPPNDQPPVTAEPAA